MGRFTLQIPRYIPQFLARKHMESLSCRISLQSAKLVSAFIERVIVIFQLGVRQVDHYFELKNYPDAWM